MTCAQNIVKSITYVFADRPSASASLQGTAVDWRRKTEPQKYCCHSFNNNVCIVNLNLSSYGYLVCYWQSLV